MSSIRTENVRALFIEFRNASIAAGKEAFGISRAFADQVEISPQVWSNIRSGRRAIGDALARRFECRLNKPEGWLDEVHTETVGPQDAKEVEFIETARCAFQIADTETRRLLVSILECIIREGVIRWDDSKIESAQAQTRLLASARSAAADAERPHD